MDLLHRGAEAVADDKLDIDELRGSHKEEWEDMRAVWRTNPMKISHGRISSAFEEAQLRQAWVRGIRNIVPMRSLYAPSGGDERTYEKLCKCLQPGMSITMKGHEGVKYEVNDLGSVRGCERGSRDFIFFAAEDVKTYLKDMSDGLHKHRYEDIKAWAMLLSEEKLGEFINAGYKIFRCSQKTDNCCSFHFTM